MTFAKDVIGRGGGPHHGTPGIRFEMHAKPTHAWSEVYLAGLSPDSQGIALRLVEGTPAPRVFFTGLRDGVVIASGLSVLDGRLASVQCMATVAAARRTGAATAILSAIESHALANGVCRLYLQTDAANTGAISVYTRYGFSLAGHYHTRVFPVSG